MIPGCFDWPEQYAGDTAEWLNFTLHQDGEPISLVDADIRMQVRHRAGKPPVISISSIGSDGIEISEPIDGVFRVGGYVNPDIHAALIYDIEVTFPSGEVRTFLRGNYCIYGQVTKNG